VNEVYFGPVRVYVPELATIDWAALIIAVAAFVALFRFKVSMLWTLAGAALAGLVYFLLFVG
jgi:chromate transporter